MRRIAAVLILALLSPFAHALNTWGTDMSDLWWNPNESGWGVNIAHQREIIFATFFVYGSNSQVKWYVAPDMVSQGGSFTFSGPLYETTGPFLGGAFNPALVASRVAGTATLSFPAINQGNLSYSVDGVTVTKSIQRQTFRRAEIAANFVGVSSAVVSGCGASGTFNAIGDLAVTLSPLPSNAIVISSQLGNGSRCTYSGTYSQSGRMGAISGTLACAGTVGSTGTFEAFDIEAGNRSIVFRYEARYGSCVEAGRVIGLAP